MIGPIKDYPHRGTHGNWGQVSEHHRPLLSSPLGSSILKPNLHSGFSQIQTSCKLLSREHVGVLNATEKVLHLPQLQLGEGSAVAALLSPRDLWLLSGRGGHLHLLLRGLKVIVAAAALTVFVVQGSGLCRANVVCCCCCYCCYFGLRFGPCTLRPFSVYNLREHGRRHIIQFFHALADSQAVTACARVAAARRTIHVLIAVDETSRFCKLRWGRADPWSWA